MMILVAASSRLAGKYQSTIASTNSCHVLDMGASIVANSSASPVRVIIVLLIFSSSVSKGGLFAYQTSSCLFHVLMSGRG